MYELNQNELAAVRNSLSVSEGHVTTSSLKIAEVFGKEHFHVIRDIESLQVPDSFRKSNFEVSEYTAKNGIGKTIKYPMYNITRDGFMFLVMGFTGAKAAAFKVAFIEQFNAMEKALLAGDTSLREAVERGEADANAVTDALFDRAVRIESTQIARLGRLPALDYHGEKIRRTLRKDGLWLYSQDLVEIGGVSPTMCSTLNKKYRKYVINKGGNPSGASRRRVLIRFPEGVESLLSRPFAEQTKEFLSWLLENAGADSTKSVKKAAPKKLEAEPKIAAKSEKFTPCRLSRVFTAAVDQLLSARGMSFESVLKQCRVSAFRIEASYSGAYNWTLPRMEAVAEVFGVSVGEMLSAGEMAEEMH